MKVFNIITAFIITVTLYILVSLISLHYLDYFVPELDLFNLSKNDIVGSIEIIDTIETIIVILLIIILYFLCFKIYPRKSYSPSLLIISNLLLVLIGFVNYLYWETEFFYTQITDSYNGYTYYGTTSKSYDL